MNRPALLSQKQLNSFQENGYLLLPKILKKNDDDNLSSFNTQIVQPVLHKFANIDESNPSTWTNMRNKEHLKTMATGDCMGEIIPGIMIRDNHNHSNELNPIRDEDSLDLSVLEPILDQMHNIPTSSTGNNSDHQSKARRNERSWEWLHTNVGWIHVRFPLEEHELNLLHHDGSSSSSAYSWHVDGGHFDPHCVNSPEQSVIILPMIRSVAKDGGGNTRVLRKSHIYMAQQLSIGDGLSKDEQTRMAKEMSFKWPEEDIVDMAPCDAGDVLLLHPFVVHSAGFAKSGNPLRISFNMGVRWTRIPQVLVSGSNDSTSERDEKVGQQSLSWLEENIKWSLQQKLDI